ncbi:NAD-dependent epimerase/dehydratase family protein [Actinoallomurus sp. NPDC052274]|uniref:NAD-dependent epimerase/dehydratase family protein n=1 Tax=Actinoallomurus sp. NPDC052274 TaxID=3155420 RepID=UPI0034248B02
MAEENFSAAVIGAGGFIGSRLAAALTERRGISVTRFTRSDPFLCDGGPVPALQAADVVCYLATTINPALAERHPERADADLHLFRGLINGLRATGRRPTVVLTSTAGALYDPTAPPPYGEDAPLRPTSEYGRAKLALERALLAAEDAVRPVVLRIANVYGHGQRTGTGQGVIGHWMESAAAFAPLRLYGSLATVRDYVYVDDVVDATIRACDVAVRRPGGPLVVNVASGRPVALGELLRIMFATIGRKLPVEFAGARTFDRRDVWFDTTRAREVLGWRPRTSLEEGMALTWRARNMIAAPR